MIKSVTVKNHLNESIELDLMRPDLSGFIVKHIDGLGPAKATINTTDLSLVDGGIFNSSRLDKRNITLDLGFYQTSTETIEDIRQKSYKYFPVKRKIELVIATDNRTSTIDGYVESNEPDIFSSNEGCSISIICPDPFFYSLIDDETAFYGIEPMFEFPFENLSTEPLLEMGRVEFKEEQRIIYEGDADIGITIRIYVVGDSTNITVANLGTSESMTINTDRLSTITGTTSFISGDVILIHTQKGKKSATLTRDGKQFNIINCLERGSDWFTLVKGTNVFAYWAETGNTNLQFFITNRVAYDGV